MTTGLRGRKGLTIIDAVFTLCIIGVLFLVVVPRYERMAQEARETALKAELANIRTSIRLFRMLNKRQPASLRELTEMKILLPARIRDGLSEGSVLNEQYLLPNAVDKNGNILDAFGHSYTYDSVNGIVRSTTQGYEDW